MPSCASLSWKNKLLKISFEHHLIHHPVSVHQGPDDESLGGVVHGAGGHAGGEVGDGVGGVGLGLVPVGDGGVVGADHVERAVVPGHAEMALKGDGVEDVEAVGGGSAGEVAPHVHALVDAGVGRVDEVGAGIEVLLRAGAVLHELAVNLDLLPALQVAHAEAFRLHQRVKVLVPEGREVLEEELDPDELAAAGDVRDQAGYAFGGRVLAAPQGVEVERFRRQVRGLVELHRVENRRFLVGPAVLDLDLGAFVEGHGEAADEAAALH